MGSCSRAERNSRFIKEAMPLVKERLTAYRLEVGDWWELEGFGLGADDGEETVKLYLTMHNKRTGDEYLLTEDNDVYFDPEGSDEDNIERLACRLGRNDLIGEREILQNRKEAIEILARADLLREGRPHAANKRPKGRRTRRQ